MRKELSKVKPPLISQNINFAKKLFFALDSIKTFEARRFYKITCFSAGLFNLC